MNNATPAEKLRGAVSLMMPGKMIPRIMPEGRIRSMHALQRRISLSSRPFFVERRFPSMFEPIHGSAPDIAGRKQANPVATVLATALMMEHLGATETAQTITRAVEDVLTRGQIRTPDLGGRATTEDMGNAIANAIERRREG